MREPKQVFTVDQVRGEARENVGVSRASSYSYMERLVGSADVLDDPRPLVESLDVGVGTLYLRFRDRRCYELLDSALKGSESVDSALELALDEVERMYPPRGLLSKQEEGREAS
jgi:hypothetical protein